MAVPYRLISRNLIFKSRFLLQHQSKNYFHKTFIARDAIEVKMPSLSPTMNQGTIVKWHKKEGDPIIPGDVLCEIQTDKAVLGFEVEEEGVLAKILKGDNSTDITVGTLIAIIADQNTDWKTVSVPTQQAEALILPATQPIEKVPADKPAKPQSSTLCGPVVRNLLDQYHISPHQVPHTGPHNILVKSDLLKYIKENSLKPASDNLTQPPTEQPKPAEPSVLKDVKKKQVAATGLSDYIDVPLSQARNLQAKQSLFSKNNIPHAYLTANCPLDAAYVLCKEFEEEKLPMSWVEIFIKAVAVTLEKFPELNATWSDGSASRSDDINVSFTVADGKASVSSTLKEASTLTALEISKQLQDSRMKYAQGNSEASSGTSPQNPSFTISFLDACGITGFASPITHPHVACLSVASPYVHLDEGMKACNLVNVTLSVNNQIVDDVAGTQFLDCLKSFLENPSLLISHRPRTSPVVLENLFK